MAQPKVPLKHHPPRDGNRTPMTPAEQEAYEEWRNGPTGAPNKSA